MLTTRWQCVMTPVPPVAAPDSSAVLPSSADTARSEGNMLTMRRHSVLTPGPALGVSPLAWPAGPLPSKPYGRDTQDVVYTEVQLR